MPFYLSAVYARSAGEGVIMHPTPAMQALIEQIYHIFVVIRRRSNLWFVVNIVWVNRNKSITEYIVASDSLFLINARNSSPDLIRKTAMRFVIFCLVYWSLLRRGNLTIFTKYFLYGVSTLPVKKTGVRMNGKYCSNLLASIWLIGYPGMRLSNYSTSWKCFPCRYRSFAIAWCHYFSSRILVGSVSCLFIEYVSWRLYQR